MMTRDACIHDPVLLTLLIAANAAIFLAYMAIPASLVWVMLRTRRIPFPAVWWLFVGFILSCGLTHAAGVLVFFRPAWHLEAAICCLTAVLSVTTAILFWRWRKTVLAAILEYERLEDAMVGEHGA